MSLHIEMGNWTIYQLLYGKSGSVTCYQELLWQTSSMKTTKTNSNPVKKRQWVFQIRKKMLEVKHIVLFSIVKSFLAQFPNSTGWDEQEQRRCIRWDHNSNVLSLRQFWPQQDHRSNKREYVTVVTYWKTSVNPSS